MQLYVDCISFLTNAWPEKKHYVSLDNPLETLGHQKYFDLNTKLRNDFIDKSARHIYMNIIWLW